MTRASKAYIGLAVPQAAGIFVWLPLFAHPELGFSDGFVAPILIAMAVGLVACIATFFVALSQSSQPGSDRERVLQMCCVLFAFLAVPLDIYFFISCVAGGASSRM